MADKSKIEWTDATWNPITGCSVVSPGCTNCYAMRLAGTRLKDHPSRKGLTAPSNAGPVWTGRTRFNVQWLDQPDRWTRPRMIFVCAHSDLFHEATSSPTIARIWKVMQRNTRHTFQVLTKRPERMEWFIRRYEIPVMPHIWLGFSAEDQTRFDERWFWMRPLANAGWLTWCSAEPLLGPIDATAAIWNEPLGNLAWMVVGGESGPGSRPMHPAWARALRDQCVAASVPFHFKQWGDWVAELQSPEDAVLPGEGRVVPTGWTDRGEATVYRLGKKLAGREMDGRTWDEMPVIQEG